MKRRLAQAIFTTVCTTAAVVGLPEKSDACLFGLFGCHGGYGCYSAPCGPCYQPVQTYYAPACNPCGYGYSPYGGGCSPCAGGSCPGGVCSVPARSDGWKPSQSRDSEPPRTFEEEPGPLGPPAEGTPPDDSGFGREAAPFGDTDPDLGVPGGIETRRPATDEDTTIPQRQPAPTPSPSDDEPAPSPAEETEDGSAAPVNFNTAPVGPVLNVEPLALDRTITASTQPVHSRLRLRSAFRSPTVVRNTNLPRGERHPAAPVIHIVRN